MFGHNNGGKYMKKIKMCLDPNRSYWFLQKGRLERMNNVAPTHSNMSIVMMDKQENIYVVGINSLFLEVNTGNYHIFCPGYECCLEYKFIPNDVKPIFDSTEFEEYVEFYDDDIPDCDCKLNCNCNNLPYCM